MYIIASSIERMMHNFGFYDYYYRVYLEIQGQGLCRGCRIYHRELRIKNVFFM
jgi:hypothetical protein